MTIKILKNYPNYAVSDEGDVYSLRTGTLSLLKWDMSTGYPRVKLYGKNKYVADLIAETFLGPPPEEGYRVCCIDGDKENCRVDNLIWLSKSDIQFFSFYTLEYKRYLVEQMRGRV